MEEVNKNWAGFRGPQGAGVSAYTNVPSKWDGKTGEGILWKTPVPLDGYNSPIVWGDRIFLTGAEPGKFQVYCYDANSGSLLWTGDVPGVNTPDGKPMDVTENVLLTGPAAPSAVTDGRRVYAIFPTGNIAAFDFQGERVWLRKLGIPENHYGHSASLAIYQDKVFVQYDQATSEDGLSKMIALNTRTGKTVWETPRPVGSSWTSPVIAKAGDAHQLLTIAEPFTIGYDPATGAELWRAECITGEPASTPVYSKGMVFALEPYNKMTAIRTDGKGDVTETHIEWIVEDDMPEVSSPVCTDEFVFVLLADCLLTCYRQQDGEKLWEHEFDDSFNASPSLVGDKLYLLDLKGNMHIVEAAGEFKEVAKCSLGEGCFASPAFADGRIYIRSRKNLYCIESAGQKEVVASKYPSMEEVNKNWASFRGPEGAGVSAYTNIPDKWDGKTGEGVLWKTPVPHEGNNSPVVWGRRIFLTGSDPDKFVHQVYCFDADSGKLLWTGDVPNAVLPDGEPLDVMEDTGLAAPTAVTDGRRVYAIFATGNIAAFDYEGKRVWLRKLGIPDSVYGYSASLAMFQDKVIVQFDQATSDDGLSKLIALDSFTGKTAWETKRPVGNSWSSPVVAKVEDNYRLITTADPWAITYDPATGAELWRAECIMGDVASTPIYSKGLAFAIEPYSRLVAIRTGGTGNVTETHVAWFAEDDIPDICSPLSTGEHVYILTSDGFLTCYQLKDGKKVYDHDIEKNFNASPSLVGGRIYMLSIKGVMFIIQAGPEYKEITTCELGEKCYASPAFTDGRIYIRGLENLYCIGTKK